jgi:hypothetical protein
MLEVIIIYGFLVVFVLIGLFVVYDLWIGEPDGEK